MTMSLEDTQRCLRKRYLKHMELVTSQPLVILTELVRKEETNHPRKDDGQ